MTDRLEGPRRKLARARRHFEDVRAILDQLDEDNASLAKQDYNEAEGRYEFSLQDDWTLHPDLPLIVGDVLHNARSALDHLAWALAREPGTHTGFPILDPARPSPRNDFYGRKQLATIKRAVKMKLERIQPYKRKHLMRSLWWLNQLDIGDKHHLVLPTAHNAPGFGTMMPDGYDIKPVATFAVARGTIFAIAVGPFDPQLQWQIKPHVDVVFTHQPVMYYPLDLVLTTILDDIEFKVFPLFGPADFWSERPMEFRLTYEGPLPATQRNEVGSVRSLKLQRKHDIRRKFHLQLKRLWEITPFLNTGARSGSSALITEESEGPIDLARETLAAKHGQDPWGFVPLVTAQLNLICALDILMLRPHAPGDVISAGDLDNRLKTLFDALRIPVPNERYSGRSPGDDEKPYFYCVLEDDKLITKVSVETDQLLEYVSSGANPDDVRLVITVRLRPYEMTLDNMQFG